MLSLDPCNVNLVKRVTSKSSKTKPNHCLRSGQLKRDMASGSILFIPVGQQPLISKLYIEYRIHMQLSKPTAIVGGPYQTLLQYLLSPSSYLYKITPLSPSTRGPKRRAASTIVIVSFKLICTFDKCGKSQCQSA